MVFADIEQVTRVCALIVAVCAAMTSVGGIFFGLNIWWKNRGKDGFKNWVHETSGSAEVAREVREAKESFNVALQRLETIQGENHESNQIAISAVSGAQERTAVGLRTFVDEHMVEAAARDSAIQVINATQARIAETLAEVAAALGRHERSRRKHPSNAA